LSLLSKVQEYNLLNHVIYQKFPEELPDCDIVFCQFGDLGQKILSMEHLSQWLQERKLVVCLRGFDVMNYINNPSDVNAEIFNKVDLFLPVCEHFKKRLITLGCNPDKIVVHHSAIDCSQFFFKVRTKPYNNRINLISVGRFVKKKGMIYAIKAIAQVVKKYPLVHFTLIGNGPERANLQLLIKKLNLQGKVTLEEWKTQQEIVSILNRSHIFLLPSITPSNGNEEGIANALKEAMAMGLISIATWHAGTPELIEDGVSGFLVPEKNSKKLASKIEYVIRHPELWGPIGLSARKKIEDEFEIEKLACQLEKLFYQLLEPV
jgi:colanic acid/amylovoran biosynthesis glycosyltransferase